MRALPIVSALVLSLSALAACSAQPEGTPPQGGNNGGAPSGTGGATGGAGAPVVGGGAPGFGGAPVGGGGAPSGTGGAPASTDGCTKVNVGAGLMGVIDDFETHAATPTIPATDNRAGQWWISVGPTGSVSPPTLPMPTGGGPLPATGGMGGGMALHFAGMDSMPLATTGWGADASVALAAPADCYDASAYGSGIKVSLMSAKSNSIYVQVITAESKAASATSGHSRTEIALSATWVDYTIPWSQLVTGWGTVLPLDLKSIKAIDFAPSVSAVADFDIWIDNVQFVK